MKTTIKDALELIKNETGLNVVAWCANNKGNGDCNLHVALLETGAERAPSFREQTGIIDHGFTAHWRGLVTPARIKRALGIS